MPPKRTTLGVKPPQSPQNVGLFPAKVLLAHVAGVLVSTSVRSNGNSLQMGQPVPTYMTIESLLDVPNIYDRQIMEPSLQKM